MLKLAEPQGLADADVKALSKQLHQTAAQYAQVLGPAGSGGRTHLACRACANNCCGAAPVGAAAAWTREASCQPASFPGSYTSERPQQDPSRAPAGPRRPAKPINRPCHAPPSTQDCEVCCFQLVTLCQEFLQQRNSPPEEVEAEPPPPESLWHEMQLRERTAAQAADAADVDFSFRASGFLGGDNWGYEDLGGSLFAEAAEPVWTGVPGSPPAQVGGPGAAGLGRVPQGSSRY